MKLLWRTIDNGAGVAYDSYMIYATKERAEEVAAMLNREPGHPAAKAILTEHGWMVRRDYKFGYTTGGVSGTGYVVPFYLWV